jgi:hypothetical protein
MVCVRIAPGVSRLRTRALADTIAARIRRFSYAEIHSGD